MYTARDLEFKDNNIHTLSCRVPIQRATSLPSFVGRHVDAFLISSVNRLTASVQAYDGFEDTLQGIVLKASFKENKP